MPQILGTEVVGHRGLPVAAPENTIKSLCAAAAAGLTWTETDVQLTSDDVPVIIHDDTVDRTTNGRGAVNTFTLAQLRRLDAGCKFVAGGDVGSGMDAGGGAAAAAEDEHKAATTPGDFVGIPTLMEYCAASAALGMGLNVELKADGSEDEQRRVAERTVEVLLDCGALPCTANDEAGGESLGTNGVRVILSSFSTIALDAAARAMRRLRPDGSFALPSALLVWHEFEKERLDGMRATRRGAETEAALRARYLDELAERAKSLGCVAVHCDRRQPLLQPGSAPAVDGAPAAPADHFCSVMHAAGLAVHVYTVNDEGEGRRLLEECRVDALFSDEALPRLRRRPAARARLSGVPMMRSSSCFSFAFLPGASAAGAAEPAFAATHRPEAPTAVPVPAVGPVDFG